MEPFNHSPVAALVDVAAEALGEGRKVWLKIAGDETWYLVTDWSFMDSDGPDADILMTAVLHAGGDRICFPTINFMALRLEESD